MKVLEKLIKNKALIIFILFLPHVYHIGFPNDSFWWIDYIIARWNILSLFILVFILVFIRKKRPSLLLLMLGIAEIWIVITTILYNPIKISKALLYVSSSLSIALIIEIYIDDLKELVSSLMLAFELQLYPNLITVFLFNKTSHLVAGYHENNFLLGTKNDLILYLLPALCLAIIYLFKIKKSVRPISLIIVVMLTVIFSFSVTTLLAFVFAFVVFVFCFFIVNNKIPNVYYIATIPILLMLVILLPYMLVGKNPIVDFIMNNIYYRHSFICRTEIWTQASSYIPKSLITGYGYINESLVYVDDIGRTYAGNAHCDFIQRFVSYGLIGVILFCVFNILIISKLNKTKDSTIKSLFISLICGIYLTFIAQDYHRFFEFQIIFFLAYYSQNIIDYNNILCLRLAKKKDVLSFYWLKQEKNNMYWTGWIDKPIFKELLAFFNKAIENSYNKKSRKIYMIDRGVCSIGYIYIDYVDEDTFHISPGISEKYQGKGYGKKAIDLALKEGVSLGFNKAEAYIREDNIASRKCFEKCGFIETNRYENKFIPNQNKEIKMIRYLYENK